MSEWIDVSVPIRHGMVHWPNNPPVTLERVKDIAQGGSSNVSALSLGVHTGTHVDAPVHFDSAAGGVETLSLDALIGPARVIEIRDPASVGEAELVAARIGEGERILLKTRNSPGAWARDTFADDAVALDVEAAHYLAARKVKTLGIDYLSVGSYRAKERGGRAPRAPRCRDHGHRGPRPHARARRGVRADLSAAQARR